MTTATEATPDAETASAATEASADEGFRESAQVWTFTAERPPLREYLAWLQATMHDEQDLEKPVTWKLRDINFVVKPYEAPDLPHDANEMLTSMATQLFIASALLLASGVLISNLLKRPTSPPGGLSPVLRERREREGREGQREGQRGVSSGSSHDNAAVWSQDLQPNADSDGGSSM